METEPHNVANPLTIDTSQMHAVADDDPSSANNFLTDSPTTALGTYPAPPAQQMNMDSEKFQVEDEHQSPPIFTATGPKLSLSRSHTTSYQKQTFRMDAGINPAETIADRLEAWRGVLKILANFFREISTAHTQVGKGYTKAASVIELPFHDSGSHFREEGGIQTVWAASREYALGQSKHHHDYSLFLDRSIIQGLRMIKREVKEMIRSIHSDDRLKTETLYRYRQQAEILQTRLNKYIQLVNTSPEHAHEKTDPYIISVCLHEQTLKLYREENRLHDSMLNLQREYAIFERKIVENTRNVLHSLQEYRTEDKFLSDHTVQSIMDTFNKLESDCEYKVFFDRRQCELVPDNASYRDLNHATFHNQQDPLVIPLKVGYMERKTFVTKNWVEHKYVLTPSGFLHEYRSEKDFPCHPELSIFIPQTTVVGKSTNQHHDHIFEIRGRNNSKGKLMKTLDRDKTYVLRTRTEEEMQSWMDQMTPMAHQFRPSVPYEPEPHMQPMNATNTDAISSPNNRATSPSYQPPSRSSTWGSTNIDNDAIQASTYDKDAVTDGVDRSGMEEATAGVSHMNMHPENIQQTDESEKEEVIDQHNPFADQPTMHQNEIEPQAAAPAPARAPEYEQPNPIQGKLPITLYDQSEPTPQTGPQANQPMPGSFTI